MAYNSNNKSARKSNSVVANKSINTDEIIINGVMQMAQRGGTWSGTMTSLQRELSREVGANRKSLPGSPSALRVALNRVVNRLRNRRVSVKFIRANDRARTRTVKFVF